MSRTLCSRLFPLLAAPAACLAQPGPAFVAGHIFHSENIACPGFQAVVREIDPVTGESWVIADGADGLCSNNGLAFTPDGRRLRVLNYATSEVLEIAPTGDVSTTLDSGDGVAGPWGQNGLIWGSNGDFYVANLGSHQLVRYPVQGGPPVVFAAGSGGLAWLPDGSLLQATGPSVRRISSNGVAVVFDELPDNQSARSVVVDPESNVFVATSSGRIYRYDRAIAESRRLIACCFTGGGGWVCLTLAIEGRALLYANPEFIYQVDPDTGAATVVFQVPPGNTGGRGLTVYIPPPLGDMNCDKRVNFFDIDPFLLALLDPPGYAARYSFCRIDLADMNADGSVNLFDIDGFVAALFAGG